jgi:hypothetical protein
VQQQAKENLVSGNNLVTRFESVFPGIAYDRQGGFDEVFGDERQKSRSGNALMQSK